jgi:hypothetical protein
VDFNHERIQRALRRGHRECPQENAESTKMENAAFMFFARQTVHVIHLREDLPGEWSSEE